MKKNKQTTVSIYQNRQGIWPGRRNYHQFSRPGMRPRHVFLLRRRRGGGH
jgi:hypothetical protein